MNAKLNTLKGIEKRLLEIEDEKPRRLHNLQENYSGSFEDEIESMDISYLDVEKTKLEMRRQFLLDKRENWKQRVFWSIIAPVVVAVIISYIASL